VMKCGGKHEESARRKRQGRCSGNHAVAEQEGKEGKKQYDRSKKGADAGQQVVGRGEWTAGWAGTRA